ncbi:hypothetical protein BKA65DRAFT_503376 [Rhexocercosporidium sp. MPI-PUGE-AT-0058]|nr:hypothetical protein BKA65DRAFT_503376 [Rhexocercosporidium sp. MPI-PUGE-AT-0058]
MVCHRDGGDSVKYITVSFCPFLGFFDHSSNPIIYSTSRLNISRTSTYYSIDHHRNIFVMFKNTNLLALALSLLSASAFAAPAPAPAPQAGTGVNDPAYSWSVTQWSAGCARHGCYYIFNISAPAYNDIPAFSAYCSGTGEGAPFQACEVNDDLPGNRGVAAHLLEAEVGAHIEVSFQWTDLEQSGTYYNYTGNATSFYNQSSAPYQNFTITPSSAFGVA